MLSFCTNVKNLSQCKENTNRMGKVCSPINQTIEANKLLPCFRGGGRRPEGLKSGGFS